MHPAVTIWLPTREGVVPSRAHDGEDFDPKGPLMPSADTDTTALLPLTAPPRRRRSRLVLAGVLAGLVAAVALGITFLVDDDRPLASGPSAVPSTADASTRPAPGGSLGTSAPVGPTTSAPPAPAVTTTSVVRPERLTAASQLSLQGIGPVDIGMTLEEASAAAGTPVRARPDDPFGPECEYAMAAAVPEVAFMVINGRIARVDAGRSPGSRVTTVSGIGRGSTEDEVKRTYPGRIRVEGHNYVPNGHYLVYVPADPALAHLSMIFETDGKVVTTFRTGLKGAVAQIEGCA